MARTGRPPKPLELKRATGNPGKRPLPDKSTTVALEPVDAVPPVPMTLDEPGRALWRDLWTGPAAKWLSAVDLVMVEGLCHLRDDIADMRKELADETRGGLTRLEPIVTPAGQVVGVKVTANPLLKELRSAEKALREHCSALGLDPASRSRLGLAEVKRQTLLEDLLRQQQAHVAGEVQPSAQVIDILPDR